MEKIDKIPEDFLLEGQLSKEQEILFLEQINRFYELKEMELYPMDISVTDDNRVMLKEGTIIHGTSGFSVDMLDSIAKTGILSGQAIGIYEDGETYCCADFHKVSDSMGMNEFNNNFKYTDARCPFGNGYRGANSLAFVIEPREEAEELLKYDCYMEDTKESALTKSFVNIDGLPGNSRNSSSILYGVPSNLICGVVLGNNLIKRKEIIELITKMFPDCYISSIDGVIIYNPSIDKNFNEVVELRAEKYSLEFEKKCLENTIKEKDNQIARVYSEQQKFIDTMILECPSEYVANVLISIYPNIRTVEDAMHFIDNSKCNNKGKSQ